jgi:predicted aspartyl protease
MPRILMMLITLSTSVAAARAASLNGSSDAVPFPHEPDGAVVIPVWFDEDGPFRFLVDTGSTLSAISDDVADRLQLHPVAQTAVTTVGGVAMRDIVQLGDMRIGALRREGLLAYVASAETLSLAAPHLDGVLGTDFLATYNFTLDYERHTLVWDDAAAHNDWEHRPGTVRLPLIPRDGRFVIPLPQDGIPRSLDMVPDSGASTFVLFTGNGRPTPPAEWADAEVTISGLTGAQRARYTRLRELRLGELRLRNVPVVMVARDDGEHTGADGLLPLHAFRRIAFRISEGYLAVQR